MLMKSYGVSLDQLTAVAQASNSLVAAGALEGADRPLRRQGAGADRKAAGRAANPGRFLAGRNGDARRHLASAADLQGRDHRHARQRPAGHDHRGFQAHRRQPDRDGRRRETRGRKAEANLAGRGAGVLHPGQVEGHPADAQRPAELGRDRRSAGGWSSSCSRSARAPRSSSASPFRHRSLPACSGCKWPG